MGTKHWIIFIVIVVAIIGGMIYTSVKNRLDVSDITNEQAQGILGPDDRNGNIGDHFIGNKDAKVILIEYGDFQCPGCKSIAPTVKSLAEKYQDDMAFVFRNFPLSSSHPNARAAAASAEAAGMQGKYWEMNEMLFAEQESWGSADTTTRGDIFLSYAREIGLDEAKFREDTANQEVLKKIDFDVALARKNNVTGTPSFLIDGQLINYQASENALEDAIKEALEKAGVKINDKTD